MSALDSPRAVNLLNLKPLVNQLTPAVIATSAVNPAKGETNNAAFSRLLAHSRSAAASQPPAAPEPRSTGNPASPTRAARQAIKDSDGSLRNTAEAAPSRTSDARASSNATARRGGADAAKNAPDPSARADAAAETSDAANPKDDDTQPQQAEGAAADLASLLAGALPPAPVAPPAVVDPGTAGSTAADLNPAASPWAALGRAGAGPAGIDASANPRAGVKGDGKGLASAIAAASTEDRRLEPAAQALAPGDPTTALDATAFSGGLPNAALASLAALSAGVGKTDEAPKNSTALDALPLGAGSAIAGQGAAHLARSIDSPASATATVSTAVGEPGFHDAFAAQVSVFARSGVSKAELHLNPAELGPVSVQITMNGDQARVDFGADRAQTRQVIEAGWAELATSLQDAGFTLSGGGVSEQAGRQAAKREAARPSGRADRSAEADDAPVMSIVAARPRAGSALDLYA